MTEYLSDEDYAEALGNGISRKQLTTRFYFWKWEKRRAITQQIGRRERGFNDSRPANKDFWYRVAKDRGMDPSTYNKRIKRGLSPEEAATRPLQSNVYKKEAVQ